MDGTIKFVLNCQERDMIKNGRFDNYINNTYALECHRGHWSEGRGSRVSDRKEIIWNTGRKDCPDYLSVDFQRDLPASIRVLEKKQDFKEKNRNRLFEIFLLIIGFVFTVLFAEELKRVISNLLS